MSQEILAKELFVDRAIVSKIENNHLTPSYVIVKEWARVTNSKDIIGLEFAGAADWKKINQMEIALKQVKTVVESVQFARVK